LWHILSHYQRIYVKYRDKHGTVFRTTGTRAEISAEWNYSQKGLKVLSLMMEAGDFYETQVHLHQTERYNIPED
jgi:hypothetical protein